MKKQVLIADADEQFRNELVVTLGACKEIEVMGVAADGHEALQIAKEKRPDSFTKHYISGCAILIISTIASVRNCHTQGTCTADIGTF